MRNRESAGLSLEVLVKAKPQWVVAAVLPIDYVSTSSPAAFTIWLTVASIAASCANTLGDPEIVVAIRYLKAKGASHAQLFLFREDGRLLRQLTNENVSFYGDTTFALDLTNSRRIRLSDNWDTPIPLPGEPAFLTLTGNRYVEIPNSSKTANRSYRSVGTRVFTKFGMASTRLRFATVRRYIALA